MATPIIRISLIAALAVWAGTLTAAADNLYRAQTIVTGQGEANRIIGFAACLEDVLIKVSGALKLAGDPRLDVYKSRSADFVSGYSYHDQMSGTPKRDEQGTRDRPYDLVVDFEDKKIDDVLRHSASSPAFAPPDPCRLCRDGAGLKAIHRHIRCKAVRPAT